MATATAQTRFGTDGRRTSPGPDPGGAGPVEPAEPPARAKKGRRKKVILAVVAALVVGGGAYKFLAPKHAGPPTGGDVVALDATTLNLAGGHYLKIGISVQLVKGKAAAADFPTGHAAELTIDEFSNRTVASLSSNAARQRLQDDLLAKLKAAYPGEVYDVFLTQFVTQ
jgi:flagellar FliL protein